MKTILILQVLCAFFMSIWVPSCMQKQSYDFKIDETETTLQIPNNYVLLSLKDYAELVRKQVDDDEESKYAEMQIEGVNELQRDKTLFLFVDSLNTDNQIYLIKMYEYAVLDTYSAEMSIEELKESLRADKSQKIKKHTILEKKVVQRVEYSYFKLKMKQEGDFGERLATIYVVSTEGKYIQKTNRHENQHSFTISFINFENKDYEDLIRDLSTP